MEPMHEIGLTDPDVLRIVPHTSRDIASCASRRTRIPLPMPALIALAAAAFLSTMVLRMPEPLVPQLAHDFAVSPSTVAWLTTAYSVPYALFQLLFGPLGDRFGKTVVVRLAVVALSLIIMAYALAPSFPALIAARFASGMFGGAIIPLGLATIGDTVAIERRQVAIARFMVAVIMGQIAGSFVTGLIAEVLPWRMISLGYGGVGLVVAVGLFLAPTAGVRSAEPLTVGVALGRYGRILTRPTAQVLLAVTFVEGMLVFGVVPFVAPYLAEIRHFTSGSIGAVAASFGLGGALFSALTVPLIRVLGAYGMITAGGFVGALATALLPIEAPIAVYAGIVFLLGFAFYLIHTNLQTRATEMAPEARGSALATFACALFLGTGLGPAIMGQAVRGIGYTEAFLIGAAALAVFGVGAAWSIRAIERIR